MEVTVTNEKLISEPSNSANVPATAEPAQTTSSDDTVSTDSLPSEDLNTDSNSVGTEPEQLEIKETMSEDIGNIVEFKDPLHGALSPNEDNKLLDNCWMTNLSPFWISENHIPLQNSKELLLLNWMIKGYESGFWSEDVPLAKWIPAPYKQLSLSSIIEIKKRIVGELECARDLKRRPKTH